jgi:hypothetical protein
VLHVVGCQVLPPQRVLGVAAVQQAHGVAEAAQHEALEGDAEGVVVQSGSLLGLALHVPLARALQLEGAWRGVAWNGEA